MKYLSFLSLTLFLLLAVACQAPMADPTATAVTQPETTPVPATETASPVPTNTTAPLATPTTETVSPTEVAPTEPAATPTAEAVTTTFLCPEIARPALGLWIPGEGHLIVDPRTGQRCRPDLEEVNPYQVGGDALYYVVGQSRPEGDEVVVKQLTAAGGQLLPFTAVSLEEASAFHTFVVSADGRRLAWVAATADGADTISQLSLAEVASGESWTPLPPYRAEGTNGSRRVLTPIRFSADNSILYYTLQPYGIGGAWSSFVSRYDNLYALRLQSEAPPELLFDCNQVGVLLCLGDFFVVDNQLSAVAYVDAAGEVVVENGAGEIINTIAVDAGYVAYPTWGPTGELVFYAADIEDSSGPPRPSAATLYRVAPPTAPAEALATDPQLLPPQAWLDGRQVVVGYMQGDSWGTAVVDVDGGLQVVEDAPDASFVAVLPPPGAEQQLPVEVTRYVDEEAGVALLYPAGWSVIDVDPAAKAESMAYAVSFFSWEPAAAGQGGIPEGGTKFDLVVIAGTTATFLEEAIAERRSQMAAMEPPETILEEQRIRLPSGLEAMRWLVESRGEQALVYLTFVEGRMIMVSGLGDFQIIDAIARSLEPLRAQP